MFILFALIGFINPSFNSIIYAARYEVFRRYLKQKIGKGGVGPSSTNQSGPSVAAKQTAVTRKAV